MAAFAVALAVGIIAGLRAMTRFDKRRLRERHGTSQCRRISPDSALQVSQATGALLEVRFVLEASYFVPCMPTSARQSVVNRVSPASCLRSR